MLPRRDSSFNDEDEWNNRVMCDLEEQGQLHAKACRQK